MPPGSRGAGGSGFGGNFGSAAGGSGFKAAGSFGSGSFGGAGFGQGGHSGGFGQGSSGHSGGFGQGGAGGQAGGFARGNGAGFGQGGSGGFGQHGGAGFGQGGAGQGFQTQHSGNIYNAPNQYQSTRQQNSADANAQILRSNSEVTAEGFSYDFETSNGIRADASGVATNGVNLKAALDTRVMTARTTASRTPLTRMATSPGVLICLLLPDPGSYLEVSGAERA